MIGDLNNVNLGKYTIEYLVKLLDACQVQLLVIGKPLGNANYVFSNEIAIGYYHKPIKTEFSIIAANLFKQVNINEINYSGLIISVNIKNSKF